MTKQNTLRNLVLPLCCICFLFLTTSASFSQPIVDTVHAIQKQNDRAYRMLENLDITGDSYTFTNVIKWKITDPDLQNQIRDALAKEPFNLKREDFDVVETYVFSAPDGPDKVEPFHILVRGFIKEKVSKSKKKTIGGPFGGGDEDNSNLQMVPKAFQGRNVVRLMHRNPVLLDNVNTIQGDNVEMPGDIVPHGSQLVKDTRMRYIFSKMFDQFYAKRVVLDEQRQYYGLPTTEEAFAAEAPAPTSVTDSLQAPVDIEATPALPDDKSNFERLRESKYEKVVDVSLADLRVNASRNLGVELEMGNKEVGLPFWSSGVSRLWLNLKNQIGSESNVKLGLVFPDPFTIGTSDWLIFPARKLSGTFGGSIDAYFAGISFFSGFNLPLAFKFSYMPAGQSSNNSIITNVPNAPNVTIGDTVIPGKQTFYREQLIMQLYVPTIIQLDLNNFLQFSIGFGIDNVYQSIIPKGTDPVTGRAYDYTKGLKAPFTADQATQIQDLIRASNTVSPHIEIDYVNQQSSKFGLSAAYDHLFTFGGWIELVEDHFRIELSYSAPIIRDAKPYEPTSFFFITPRFYF